MANYISKFTGIEIDNILDKAKSGSGVPIVESVNDLDPNAPLGTLAVVAKQGYIQECNVSDLPQIDPNTVNPDTGVIDTSNFPKAFGISFLIPESPNVTISSTDVPDMLFFISENVSLNNNESGSGSIMILAPQVADNKLIAFPGIYMDIATNTQKEWLFFSFDENENITVDQSAIDECNSYVNGLYYIGNLLGIAMNGSVSPGLMQFYDTIVKVISGVPTETSVYQKNDNWEKLYNTEFETIQTKLNDLLNSKKIIRSNLSEMELTPNRYYINTDNYLYSLTITLGEITDPSIVNEYFVEFTTYNNTTVSLPASIKWQNGNTPTFEPNTTYQISIINNLGIITRFN